MDESEDDRDAVGVGEDDEDEFEPLWVDDGGGRRGCRRFDDVLDAMKSRLGSALVSEAAEELAE